MIAVADAGPLIVLGRTGHLRVLEQIFTRVVVPDSVWAEVMADGGTRPGAAEVQGSPWLVRHPDLRAVARSALGAGEAQAIALAAQLDAGRVLLDDLAARREASRRGLTPLGTLGILAEASRLRLVPDLPAALLMVRGAGLLVSDALIANVLAQATAVKPDRD